MPETSLRNSASGVFERIGVLPLLGMLGLAATSAVLGPEIFTLVLIGMTGAVVIAVRPQWGVGMILFLLMVQYGSRRYDREGVAGGVSSLLPQGSGLFTPNNLLGVFLALLLIYQVYLDGDWSFLRSRVLQLMLAITLVLVFSGFISGINPNDQVEIGVIATSGQDPSRLLITRALFLVLLVYFVRKPNDVRTIVALFVFLAVVTAWSGSGAAITGTGRAEVSTYRAGGTEVLIESTQNPNRLAMIATLGLVFIWEYSQAYRLKRWVRWGALAVILLMVVTVFLSASRGGLIGLVVAGMMLFVRRRGGSGRLLYGLAVIGIAGMLIQEVVPEQAMERITNIPGISHEDPNASNAGEGSIERRKYTYEIGINIWRKAPIVGIGPGNWPYVRFMTDPLRSAAAAHNSYLEALAEGGIVTLGLYAVLFYVVIRDLLRCERDPRIVEQAKQDGLEWLLAATRICLIAFLVFSLFADLWDLVFSYFLLGVSAVLIERYRPTAVLVPAHARPLAVAA
jgi:O-antigen ligase